MYKRQLEAYLNGQDNIQKATVYERTGDVVLTYRGSRKAVSYTHLDVYKRQLFINVQTTANDSITA